MDWILGKWIGMFLVVFGVVNLVKCSDWVSSDSFWVHYNIPLTYLLTHLLESKTVGGVDCIWSMCTTAFYANVTAYFTSKNWDDSDHRSIRNMTKTQPCWCQNVALVHGCQAPQRHSLSSQKRCEAAARAPLSASCAVHYAFTSPSRLPGCRLPQHCHTGRAEAPGIKAAAICVPTDRPGLSGGDKRSSRRPTPELVGSALKLQTDSRIFSRITAVRVYAHIDI